MVRVRAPTWSHLEVTSHILGFFYDVFFQKKDLRESTCISRGSGRQRESKKQASQVGTPVPGPLVYDLSQRQTLSQLSYTGVPPTPFFFFFRYCR